MSADLNARRAVRSAAHSYSQAEQRWSERRERGLLDRELVAALAQEFGEWGGTTGPGFYLKYRGGKSPVVQYADPDTGEEMVLRGRTLLKTARAELQIPSPVLRVGAIYRSRRGRLFRVDQVERSQRGACSHLYTTSDTAGEQRREKATALLRSLDSATPVPEVVVHRAFGALAAKRLVPWEVLQAFRSRHEAALVGLAHAAVSNRFEGDYSEHFAQSPWLKSALPWALETLNVQPQGPALGHGGGGLVLQVDDGRVLKLTSRPGEVAFWTRLNNPNDPPLLYGVPRVDQVITGEHEGLAGKVTVAAVLREAVTPLTPSQKAQAGRRVARGAVPVSTQAKLTPSERRLPSFSAFGKKHTPLSWAHELARAHDHFVQAGQHARARCALAEYRAWLVKAAETTPSELKHVASAVAHMTAAGADEFPDHPIFDARLHNVGLRKSGRFSGAVLFDAELTEHGPAVSDEAVLESLTCFLYTRGDSKRSAKAKKARRQRAEGLLGLARGTLGAKRRDRVLRRLNEYPDEREAFRLLTGRRLERSLKGLAGQTDVTPETALPTHIVPSGLPPKDERIYAAAHLSLLDALRPYRKHARAYYRSLLAGHGSVRFKGGGFAHTDADADATAYVLEASETFPNGAVSDGAGAYPVPANWTPTDKHRQVDSTADQLLDIRARTTGVRIEALPTVPFWEWTHHDRVVTPGEYHADSKAQLTSGSIANPLLLAVMMEAIGWPKDAELEQRVTPSALGQVLLTDGTRVRAGVMPLRLD